MAAIPLSQANRAYITLAPPWAKRLFKIGRLAYAPGVMPPQLERYATDASFRNRALAQAQAVVRAHATGGGRGRALPRGRRGRRAPAAALESFF
ncbi:MAG: hypothetical protein Q8R28_14990 [Dehalococcoidia bacterium]|nr:hypothetical protein [Dehalococcoidia bacterium]